MILPEDPLTDLSNHNCWEPVKASGHRRTHLPWFFPFAGFGPRFGPEGGRWRRWFRSTTHSSIPLCFFGSLLFQLRRADLLGHDPIIHEPGPHRSFGGRIHFLPKMVDFLGLIWPLSKLLYRHFCRLDGLHCHASSSESVKVVEFSPSVWGPLALCIGDVLLPSGDSL